jgi:hypothetical protein
MNGIEALQAEWIKKFAEMRESLPSHNLQGPFLSVPPRNYEPDRIPSVLYVGKATFGDWCDWGHEARPEELRDKVREVQLEVEKSRRAFWAFARRLSEFLGTRTGIPIDFLQNLLWTNICKLAVAQGNPN